MMPGGRDVAGPSILEKAGRLSTIQDSIQVYLLKWLLLDHLFHAIDPLTTAQGCLVELTGLLSECGDILSNFFERTIGVDFLQFLHEN
jgi:hypothetical protein